MNTLKRILVIESVFDETCLHDAGSSFEAQIFPLCQAHGIEFDRKLFLSLPDCLGGLQTIKNTASADGITALHIICHGTDDMFRKGLAYKLDQRYIEIAQKLHLREDFMIHSWNALRSDLTSINKITDDNLFLSMCVCHGAKIFENCNTPFAKYTVASNDVLRMDDIQQTFVDVYKELITSSDIENIKKVIENSNGKNQGRSQLSLYDGLGAVI